MLNFDKALKKLKSSGYKLTPQRLEIIRILTEIGHKHPSIREIYEIASKRVPTISFSTLYTIIQTLEDLGILKTFALGKETHVEVNTRPHINLVSLKSGEIIDVVEDRLIDEFKKIAEKIYGERDLKVHFINIYIE